MTMAMIREMVNEMSKGINIPVTALGEADLTFGCNLFTGMD